MRILHITPHLSTGGLPRYLLSRVETQVGNGDEVWVVEWSDIAPAFRVQKDKLGELLSDRLVSWPQGTEDYIKANDLYRLLDRIRPDVVHFAEFPEGFIPTDVVSQIYGSKYVIYETTHDSAFEPSKKVTKPKRFEFVSEYHQELFSDYAFLYGIENVIVPYEVETGTMWTKEKAALDLELDLDCKHVLNVGLFTPGKNQGECIEIANSMLAEKVVFHFVGNQAGNFEDYWEPLMKELPSNCVIWGEQEDVGKFYAGMDLLLFTSKSELMPLVPIEALAYGMPVLMYEDDVYGGRFDGLVEWLGETGEKNCELVRSTLGFSSLRKSKIKLVHLLTRPEDERERKSVESLSELEKFGIEYVQRVSKPCEEYPVDLPALQVHKEKKPGYYGAYKAFREGIEKEFDEDLDFLVVCECDCVLEVEPGEFAARLDEVSKIDFDYLSFGQEIEYNKTSYIDDTFYQTDKVILAHCIVFPQSSREHLFRSYKELPWDSPDLWLDYCFSGMKKVVTYSPLARQFEGFSLIDNEYKTEGRKSKEIEGYFDFEDIYTHVVDSVEKGHFVEIGSWLGKSTVFLAQKIKDSEKDIKLDAVDKWEPFAGADYPDRIFNENVRIKNLTDYIHPKKMSSIEASYLYQDKSLNFIFIDADHSYTSVTEDISIWYPKLKDGGMIAGHDVIPEFPGVYRAVEDFFGDDFLVSNHSWYHTKGKGKTESIIKEPDVEFIYSFVNQPKVEIKGRSDETYTIEFIDNETGEALFKTDIGTNCWAACGRKYFTHYKIRVSSKEKVLDEFVLDLKDKRVLITFGSKSLGDTIAWFQYVEEFRKKHSCEVVVSTFWNKLFDKEYPELDFVEPGSTVPNVYVSYNLGCFDDDDGSRHKKDWRTIPMQQIATDILGLDYVEKKPRLVVPEYKNIHKKKYVSMSEFSTLACKFWQLDGGWQDLVNKIRDDLKLDVMAVSKEQTKLYNVRRCTNKHIKETIRNIKYSEAFIGVGSGLTWLAWALDVPVVMISGFSEEFCEFSSSDKVSRVINKDVCHGCFNDIEYAFNRGDWNWCPRGEDFECSKQISVNKVLEGLRKVLV